MKPDRCSAAFIALSAVFLFLGRSQGSTSAAPLPQNVPRITVPADVQETKAIRKVPPVYPPDAKANNVEGTVVLQAVIASDGTVKELTVLFGDPIFRSSSLTAVKQWLYKPTLLNGKPVEVDTTITVVYRLK